jgi:hypothetical protein
MADRKISDLTALTTPASGDYLPIVDISEAAAASKNKRITIEELMRGVPNGTAAAPGIAFETDPNTGIYSPGADQLAVATNGTGRLFVGANGNVGIGISAARTLDVNGTSYFRGAVDFFNPAGGAVTSSKLIFGSAALPSAASIFSQTETGTAGNLQLQTAQTGTGTLTERMRIDSSGRVGIGTSSPATLLEVRGLSNAYTGGTTPVALRISDNGTDVGAATWSTTTDFTQLQFFSNDASSPGGANVRYSVGAVMETNTGISSALAFRSYSAGSPTERMRITSTGNVGVGTISPAGRVHVALAARLSKLWTMLTISCDL